MSIFRQRFTLAAAGVETNAMNGSKFEFLSRPAAVELFATQDGAGSPNAQVDFTLGNAVVGEDINPNPAATAGAVNQREDAIGAGAGMPGDRIQLRLRNTDVANAVNVTVLVRITELA